MIDLNGRKLILVTGSPRSGTTAVGDRLSLPISIGRLIPLAPALPTFGDERAIGARLQPATDKMLIAPEATA
jgi:hypothetical protein